LFVAKLGIVLALASLVGGPAASPQLVVHPASSIPLRGYDRLVADGTRAAAANGCSIALWSAGTRKPSHIEACRGGRALEGGGLDEFALAGNRLAWMREEYQSHALQVQTELVVKNGSARPRQIASAYDDAGFGGLLISLAGRGETLAFASTYQFDEDFEDHVFRISPTAGAGPCPFDEGAILPNPPQTTFCADTGLSTGLVRGVSDGRILVSIAGFQIISVVEPDNAVVDLQVPATEKHLELGISGTDVVVVKAGTATLDMYDAVAGTLRRRWPIAKVGSVSRLSVGGGFALFAWRGFHLVRLSDGKERSVLAPGRKPLIAATLSERGLFMLYRVKHGARLGFVPVSRL
jgi:hypothetical protein